MKALITGVNSLVNEALLQRLIDMEYEVVAHYHTNNKITIKLKKAYPQVTFVQANFEEQESFAQFLEKIITMAPFDVIINGAVYYPEVNGPEAQLNWQAWQKAFAINTTACGLILSHANHLIKKGVIINISSLNGVKYMGDVDYAIYSATKSALDSLTMTYAKRWVPNIRIVGIAPGQVKSAWNEGMSEQEVNDVLKDQLATKLIEPDEIADVMELMIKNQSINATTYLIDGGYSAPMYK